MTTPLVESPSAATTFALQMLLRNEKADYFALANTSADRSKILNNNPDLKMLFNILDDLSIEKTKDINSPELKNRLTNLFRGQGDEGEVYHLGIESAIRNGLLDDVSKMDLDKNILQFNEDKVKAIALVAADVVLDMDLPFTREYRGHQLDEFKPAPLENYIAPDAPVLYEAMNALQGAYSQDAVQSTATVNAVALDMANNASVTQRAEIIAQSPGIAGAALFYASQEISATTASEQAALPHINDKLVAMVLDDDPTIIKLNNHSQQVINEMAHGIDIENELG